MWVKQKRVVFFWSKQIVFFFWPLKKKQDFFKNSFLLLFLFAKLNIFDEHTASNTL